MARNIDVAKQLSAYELVDLAQLTVLTKGLTEMVERRTTSAIEDCENKLKLLKSGTVSPESLVVPAKRSRTGKKKKGNQEEVTDAELETND